MIIWGSTGREIEKERGDFHCPRCDESREYKKMRVATYFTLYFIPLFETKHHGDFVECLGCHGQFVPEVLDHTPSTQAERLVASVRADLEAGTPLQMARTKLVNEGMAAETAEGLVEVAAGDGTRTCPQCKSSFVSTVGKCSGCGNPLGRETGIRG